MGVEKPNMVIRPEWRVLLQDCEAGYVYCDCGEILQTTAQVRDHWQLGHFDYVEDASLVAEMLKALEAWDEWSSKENTDFKEFNTVRDMGRSAIAKARGM